MACSKKSTAENSVCSPGDRELLKRYALDTEKFEKCVCHTYTARKVF